MTKNILLIEPDFPYPSKSKNRANSIHKNFVPVGLLKLGAYYKSIGANVKLIRGYQPALYFLNFQPTLVLVTSIFTYWSEYFWDAVRYYRRLFPQATILVGGVYVALHHEKEYFQKLIRHYRVKYCPGLHHGAERHYPDYSLLTGKVDHHVTHAMRGCIRRCNFCGVWKIEPERYDKTPKALIKEIRAVGKNKVIFFDNNFLANSHVKSILSQLATLKVNNRAVFCESQSGFDGRLLEKNPVLGRLLKQARFQNVKIAWDNSLEDAPSIKKQIDILVSAGYIAKDISVFMIYNFDATYETMLKKLKYCRQWGVQIADCRYRPLDSTADNYNSARFRTGQMGDDYYIHTKAGWTDGKIRNFRKKVRQHNIWVRYAMEKSLEYDKAMERWSAIHNTFKFFKMGRPPQLEVIQNSYRWKNRIRLMNRIKSYYKKHNMNSLNFNGLTYKKVDEELNKILQNI